MKKAIMIIILIFLQKLKRFNMELHQIKEKNGKEESINQENKEI